VRAQQKMGAPYRKEVFAAWNGRGCVTSGIKRILLRGCSDSGRKESHFWPFEPEEPPRESSKPGWLCAPINQEGGPAGWGSLPESARCEWSLAEPIWAAVKYSQ